LVVPAVEAALTLADKIVDLISKYRDHKKIENNNFDLLQKWSRDLRNQLAKSSDIRELLRVLEKAEIGSSYVKELEELIVFIDQVTMINPEWAKEKQPGHMIYELVKKLTHDIEEFKIETDLRKELVKYEGARKDHYMLLSKTAESSADKAKDAPNWEQMTTAISAIDNPIDEIIIDIESRITEMTQSLFPDKNKAPSGADR